MSLAVIVKIAQLKRLERESATSKSWVTWSLLAWIANEIMKSSVMTLLKGF